MEILKKDKSILIKNRPTSFIVLEFIEIETILDIVDLNNPLPNQYTEIFKYIFNRIKPFIKNLNKKEIEEIFNDINLLNEEADNNIINDYLDRENGTYEIFITPVSRLKEIIKKQETNNNINWANYFDVLALSLIGGVNNPGPVINNLINLNPDDEIEKRQRIAGELAAYSMEAVDHAEVIKKEFGKKTKIRHQNKENALKGHAKSRALNIKLCDEYFKNNYQKLKNSQAAYNLYNKHKDEIEDPKTRCSFHTIEKWIKVWKDKGQTSI